MFASMMLMLLLADGGMDVAVVRPPQFAPALRAWKETRATEHYRIHEIDSHSQASEVRKRIIELSKKPGMNLQFVVLAADAPSVTEAPNADHANHSIPTFYPQSKVVHLFGSEQTIGSDHPYSDLDGDHIPDVAIGRIPADDPNELRNYLERVLAYEANQDVGPWRDRIDVVAGVGGFGALIDSTIEMVTKKFLTDGIPNTYTLGMTYASLSSPYCPNPFEFSKATINSLNRGSMFWIYIGHGHVQTLDRFQVGPDAVDILNNKMIDKVQIEAGPPIALFLACYTGAFDAPVDSLAEVLVKRPQGPIACIAGTRMTMPYGMSCLGAEMLTGCFKDHEKTIGELLLHAKQRSVQEEGSDAIFSPQRKLLDSLASSLGPDGHPLPDERKDHLALIHLLGDPTMQLRYPESIEIKIPKSIAPGTMLSVVGTSPIAEGEVLIELGYRRDRLPASIAPVTEFAPTKEIVEQMEKTYVEANHTVMATKQVLVESGRFSTEFAIPEDASGKYVIRTFHRSTKTWATGSTEILVRIPRTK